MLAQGRLAGALEGADTGMFQSYWNAIKNRINDLRNLPAWTTNHAMKLGMVVSELRAKGRPDLADAYELEIKKVNDDIRKAWKVKGYIDTYLPEWMSAANSGAGAVQGGMMVGPQQDQGPTMQSGAFYSGTSAQSQPGIIDRVSQAAADAKDTVTGWFSGMFKSSDEQVNGLGFVPLVVISASAIAALAYVVTQGMALYQDYVSKKDLTVAVIEGKLTSGQAAEILTAERPPEEDSIIENIVENVGSNVGTVVVLGGLAYAAIWYFMLRRN
jgi:hypothetical protein